MRNERDNFEYEIVRQRNNEKGIFAKIAESPYLWVLDVVLFIGSIVLIWRLIVWVRR